MVGLEKAWHLTSRCSRRGPRQHSDNARRRAAARAAERQRSAALAQALRRDAIVDMMSTPARRHQPVSRSRVSCAISSMVGIILSLSACGGDAPESATVPGDFSVTLQRSVCFGPCPAYMVSVDASGLVQYDGARCVAVSDHQESSLPPRRLGQLLAAFEEIDFFALQDIYRNDDGYCSPGFFDGTVISITLRADGMVKTVADWHGCNPEDVAARLEAFEERVDELLGTAKWVPCWTGQLEYPDYSECAGKAGVSVKVRCRTNRCSGVAEMDGGWPVAPQQARRCRRSLIAEGAGSDQRQWPSRRVTPTRRRSNKPFQPMRVM